MKSKQKKSSAEIAQIELTVTSVIDLTKEVAILAQGVETVALLKLSSTYSKASLTHKTTLQILTLELTCVKSLTKVAANF